VCFEKHDTAVADSGVRLAPSTFFVGMAHGGGWKIRVRLDPYTDLKRELVRRVLGSFWIPFFGAVVDRGCR